MFVACEVFPGDAVSVGLARRYIRKMIVGCPVESDAVLLTSEIATNAVRHTRSGDAGGSFTVAVLVHEHYVRVDVTDQGPRDAIPVQRRDSDDGTEGGRGLHIVDSMATRWGMTGTPTSHVVWFELDWTATDADKREPPMA